MNLDSIHRVYFIGIGGIGMSAIARYFLSLGKNVAGYDRVATPLTENLQNEGANIHFEDDVDQIGADFKTKENTLVVYTPAIPTEHRELTFFRKEGYQLHKRSEVLGLISKNQTCLAIAGTHGKTTTSSMLAHVLDHASTPVSAFLGGICTNFDSNYISRANANTVVVEADEFDRSFLTLSPDVAVVTSTDPDHLDIYGSHDSMLDSFSDFVNLLGDEGLLIKKKGLEIGLPNELTYSVEEAADYYIENLVIENGKYIYDVYTPQGVIESIQLGMAGIHNVENSLGVIAVSEYMGLSHEQIKSGLSTFKGVKRRFEHIVNSESVVYIDDYAHHPSELRSTIGSVKQMFPEKRITGVFQPHLYSRTKDFADEFAQSLSALDELVLLDIYPARELPIPGVTSQMILEKAECEVKELSTPEGFISGIKNRELEVLLTLGAGDIDRLVQPIRTELESLLKEKGIEVIE